jgi:hypothetical protein
MKPEMERVHFALRLVLTAMIEDFINRLSICNEELGLLHG